MKIPQAASYIIVSEARDYQHGDFYLGIFEQSISDAINDCIYENDILPEDLIDVKITSSSLGEDNTRIQCTVVILYRKEMSSDYFTEGE